MSMRTRLVLSLMLGVVVPVAVLFFALDWLIDRELYGRFDAALLERARAMAAVMQVRSTQASRAERWWPEFSKGGHTDYYQVWDTSGRTLLRSDTLEGRNIRHPASASQPLFYDTELPDGHAGRAVILRVSMSDTAPRVLVVASEREALDQLENRLHFMLVTGVGAALVAVMVLTALALRRGLRPLADFADSAARLSADPAAPPPPSSSLPAELVPVGRTLERAMATLVEALEQERRFAHSVAHELRTPLAEARSLTELALRRHPDEAARADLRSVLDSLSGMSRSVEGLLALTRYEAGLATPALEPVDLATVIRDQCAPLRDTAALRRLSLDLDVPGEIWVMTDMALIERVIANLLANAVQYSPEGSRVTVRATDGEAGPRLVVANPAPALTEGDLARLGERYFRKTPSEDPANHAGLGLALTRALTRLLELDLHFRLEAGSIEVELGGFKPLPPTS